MLFGQLPVSGMLSATYLYLDGLYGVHIILVVLQVLSLKELNSTAGFQ